MEKNSKKFLLKKWKNKDEKMHFCIHEITRLNEWKNRQIIKVTRLKESTRWFPRHHHQLAVMLFVWKNCCHLRISDGYSALGLNKVIAAPVNSSTTDIVVYVPSGLANCVVRSSFAYSAVSVTTTTKHLNQMLPLPSANNNNNNPFIGRHLLMLNLQLVLNTAAVF